MFLNLKYIPLSSNSLIPFVYFYVLGESIMFPDLIVMAFYRRCPMRPSNMLLCAPMSPKLYPLVIIPMWIMYVLLFGRNDYYGHTERSGWVIRRQGWLPVGWPCRPAEFVADASLLISKTLSLYHYVNDPRGIRAGSSPMASGAGSPCGCLHALGRLRAGTIPLKAGTRFLCRNLCCL